MNRLNELGISAKVVAVVIGGLLVVLGGGSLLLDMTYYNRKTDEGNRKKARMFSEGVLKAINYPMLIGDHKTVQYILEDFGQMEAAGVKHIALYSSTGKITNSSDPKKKGMVVENPLLKESLGNKLVVNFDKSSKTFSHIFPISNRADCFKCHGETLPILGALEVDLDLTADVREARLARILNGAIILTAIFVLGGLILGLLHRLVLQPINRIVGTASRIGEGDLTGTVAVESKDEIGALAGIFSKVVSYLKAALTKIKGEIERITLTAKSFSLATESLQKTMSQLADSISQISNTAAQVSESTQAASSDALKASSSAEEGKVVLEKVDMEMNRIHSVSESTAKVVVELGGCFQEILEIVEIITHIAGQTNLLSVNAAIEAARAGEAGRGLTVVSERIRKLADDSADAGKRINELVKGIQQRTTDALSMSSQVVAEVKEGMKLTKEAVSKFSEIADSSRNIARQIETIAASAEETAALTEEASSTGELQVGSVSEISGAARTLYQISGELENLAAKFKVD